MAFSNQLDGHVTVAAPCDCPPTHLDKPKARWASTIHLDEQDSGSEAWARLLELIDDTVDEGRELFAPGRDLGPQLWSQIVTLPPTIARLTEVTDLNLYGSNLRSIPPAVGSMRALERFVPYTSYRLHWFPFEITACTSLVDSTVSTRAVYGNYKHRPTFPRLPTALPADAVAADCSLCQSSLHGRKILQRWISLRVGTDVLPLLAQLCSAECVSALPTPPDGYVQHPHEGGPEVEQPEIV